VYLLLVERDPDRRRAVHGLLRAVGHRVEGAGTGAEALTVLARPGGPDLVIVAERLADMDALEFLRAAVRLSVRAGIVVLGAEDVAGRWVEATRLGVRDYVTVDPEGAWLSTFAARLDAARQRSTEEERGDRLADALDSTSAAVLLVDRAGRLEYANAAGARLLGRTPRDLAHQGLGDVLSLDDAPAVRAELFAALDVGGEWAGEIDVLRGSRDRVPCLATLSPVRRGGGRIDGLVLTLRSVSERVAMEDALRAANRRLADQATRDHLTGIYNRAYFLDVLEREVARGLRYEDPLAVVMLDLDGFKELNDDLGHGAGDEALRRVAAALGEGLREGDVLARYGGDEFCVLLPHTEAAPARAVAERLVARVPAIALAGGRTLHASAGVACSTDLPEVHAGAAAVLLRAADDALLDAKREGGGCVVTRSRTPARRT
jgi:diguanylate cyclase (GGDEF)-like protein/PAS domain S-box-containing protein